MSKTLFATEMRLENELSQMDLQDFQGGAYVSPMDYNAISTIPGPAAAMMMPPQGPFGTAQMVDMSSDRGDTSDDSKTSSDLFVLWVILGGIAVFYLLKPR